MIAVPFEAPAESGADNRIDGRLKVTGAMPYAADVQIPGALHAVAVRSPYPHARILAIDAAEARALPGVHCILTGAHVPNILFGRAFRDVPILAVDKVRFAGEMVAAVAADSREAAEEAAARIHIEYEPLPAVFDPDEALKADAVRVHDQPWTYPGAVRGPDDHPNVVARSLWTVGDDVEAALASSERVFQRTWRTQKVHQGYIEPHCCTVHFDASGKVRIWSCNKAPYRLRQHLGDAFDLNPEDIEGYTTAIGGDFGGKGSPMDIPLCLELSRRTGRPVRMARTYAEELMAGDPRHSSVTRIRMGVTRDGRIQAMDVLALFNSGAYGGYRPSAGMRSACATSYRVPCARVESIRVYTNEVPCGNMRAPGAPQTTFAVESMMDYVARELGIDSFEFRRRNLLKTGEATVMGDVWPEVRGIETLDLAEHSYQPVGAPPGLLVGRGVAVYDRPTHAPQRTSLRLRLQPDAAVEAQVPIMETGTGSHTMLQRVLASALGVDRSRVVMRYVGTPFLPWDEGVGGSRVTVAAAEAGVATAKAFKAELASKLGVAPEALDVPDALRTLAARGVELEVVGQAGGRGDHGGDGATSFCVQVAQVGVDPETGQVRLLDFLSANDVAEVIDPLSHRGQIEGGIAMGIGQALTEDLGILDGRVTATHLGEYKLPTMPDMPPLKVVLLPGGIGVGARNVKSIGEMGNVPAPAAVANAVSDAIGASIDSLPITPEKVLAALSPARQRRG